MCSTSEIGSHHPHVGRHDGTPLARPFHELLCTLLAEAQAEGRGNKHLLVTMKLCTFFFRADASMKSEKREKEEPDIHLTI